MKNLFVIIAYALSITTIVSVIKAYRDRLILEYDYKNF